MSQLLLSLKKVTLMVCVVGVTVLERGVDSVLVEMNWLDIVLVVVHVIQLGVVVTIVALMAL